MAQGVVYDHAASPFYASFDSSDIVPISWTIDSTVLFDLCLDAARNRLSAANVTLTDEAFEEAGLSIGTEGPWVFGCVDGVKHIKGPLYFSINYSIILQVLLYSTTIYNILLLCCT